MKKTLYSLLLLLLLSGCDFDKLPGPPPPPPPPPKDADFISLTGTRLKTFMMKPDASQMELPVTISLTGHGSYSEQVNHPVQTGPESWENHYVWEDFSYTESVTTTVPLNVACYPSDYIASFRTALLERSLSGTPTFYHHYLVSRTFNRQYSEVVPTVNPDYEEFDEESFSCDSYIVPEKGYAEDKNFFIIKNFQFPSLTPLVGLNNTTPLSSGAFSYTFFYRKVSREFFLYRSISITFAPSIEVFGWQGHDGNVSEIIDRFEFDPETNTLTAFFKDYFDNTLGDAFSFFIIAEDGSVKTKTVSIGYKD